MMADRETALGLSWHDSAAIPVLNPGNIMDYFMDKSNPFYDRTCNNEIVKMQRVNPDQLNNMTGLEYILLHVQEPVLYVIRKQHRHSSTQVTPQADYYIIAGVVYQAPDLCSVLNSRMLNTIHYLQSAFEEASSFSRYHPSKGYWWEFKEKQQETKRDKKEKKKRNEEIGSIFQTQRVDTLLEELTRKFPPKFIQPPTEKPADEPLAIKTEPKTEVVIKEESATNQQVAPPMQRQAPPPENTKPPPEKKPKLLR